MSNTESGAVVGPYRARGMGRVTTRSRDFRTRASGTIALMFALLLISILGLIALALDMARIYNRKIELQIVADAAALAAARQLIGTSAGITNAVNKASQTLGSLKYEYNKLPIAWSESAIQFSTSAGSDAVWMDATSAAANPSGVYFAKVDTTGLNEAYNTVETLFARALPSGPSSVTIKGFAIAGRSTIKTIPLAICAMSNNPAASRNNPGPPANSELEEFGFRRGAAYDLMQLNPGGVAPETFVINPIDPIGTIGSLGNTSAAVVAPFVCTGSMPMPRVMGNPISVARPFPIATLFTALNSRFDQFTSGQCSPNGAPPDANVRPFAFGSVNWMSATPGLPAAQSAQSTTVRSRLETIAALSAPESSTNTAPMYGPLWAFAKAVPFSAYSAGTPEPTTGYAPFTTGAWATLYSPGKPVASGLYPSSTPYQATSGANFLAPPANPPGLRLRRVLNVPLLSCPVAAGGNVMASVIGIGRFFMTVPATSTSIFAEFAGAVPEPALGGPVELQ